MTTRRLSTLLAIALGGFFLSLSALPAAAQSAQSIAEKMNTRYQERLESVDNYVVETTMYTSYHRKVMKDGAPTLETSIEMKSESPLLSGFTSAPTTTSTKPAYYDQLSEDGTYTGSETVNGTQCYVLRVDNPSEMHDNASQAFYYIDTEQYVPRRIRMVTPPQQKGGKPTEVLITFADYRTTKGLTLPWRTTMQMKMNMSEKQRQQMKRMIKKLEQLPESQRKVMEKQMPFSFDRMKQIVTGEPTTIEVTSVRVNEGLPEGAFDSSDGGR